MGSVGRLGHVRCCSAMPGSCRTAASTSPLWNSLGTPSRGRQDPDVRRWRAPRYVGILPSSASRSQAGTCKRGDVDGAVLHEPGIAERHLRRDPTCPLAPCPGMAAKSSGLFQGQIARGGALDDGFPQRVLTTTMPRTRRAATPRPRQSPQWARHRSTAGSPWVIVRVL